ncbi:MAG: CD225/dispanin family protein [Tannerella sp.]|nr:CD225/dispanin family protein [Tannerella sp.]
MICSKCGAQNLDGVTFCGSCGTMMTSVTEGSVPNNGTGAGNVMTPQQVITQPVGGASNGGTVMPKDYMTESIIVTIVSFVCCCNPISIILGIIAIIKANGVKSEFQAGRYDSAISSANAAKTLLIIAVVIAVIGTVVSVILSLLGIGAFGTALEQIMESAGGF